MISLLRLPVLFLSQCWPTAAFLSLTSFRSEHVPASHEIDRIAVTSKAMKQNKCLLAVHRAYQPVQAEDSAACQHCSLSSKGA